MRPAGQCTGLLLVAVVNFIARALGFLNFTLVEKAVAGLKGMADFLLVAITNSFARVLGVGDLYFDDFLDFIQFCLAFIKLAVAGFCRVCLAECRRPFSGNQQLCRNSPWVPTFGSWSPRPPGRVCSVFWVVFGHFQNCQG